MLQRHKATSAKLIDSAPVFAALGDPTRLRLFAQLCVDGPQSIVSLCATSTVSRQAVAKHLQALATAGLVRDTRRGRERIYSPAPRRLEEARRCLERISAQWDDALQRLRSFVEE